MRTTPGVPLLFEKREMPRKSFSLARPASGISVVLNSSTTFPTHLGTMAHFTAAVSNGIYQLPLGRGKTFLAGAHGALDRVVGGWEIAGVGRLQSGTPTNLLSGRATFNQNDGGVVLHNLTASQLQDMMNVNHTSQINSNGSVTGTVYYLPPL
jgi:hypothetical protein